MNIHSWPKAIIHIDGDSFFASCVQSLHPEFRGKPLVTGGDRGVATSVSPEAKKLGIARTTPIYEIRQKYPQCIIKNTDFDTYSLISHKMFEVMRNYTPFVEVYSIDEGFADITGLRRLYHKTYEQIAHDIQQEIMESVNIPISLGLSINKSIAKLASNYRKPRGFCVYSGKDIVELLKNIPIESVWGIGPNTGSLLKKYGIFKAIDLAFKKEEFVTKILSKPGIEIWRELNGEYIFKINPDPRDSYKSISKIRTFSPPSNNRQFLYAELINNLEKVCEKARRYKLVSKKASFSLKGQDFKMYGAEMTLPLETAYPLEIAPHLKKAFDKIFDPKRIYRATYVCLYNLAIPQEKQYSLFDNQERGEKIKLLFDSIDELSEKYGTKIVTSASTLRLEEAHVKKRFIIPFFRAVV